MEEYLDSSINSKSANDMYGSGDVIKTRLDTRDILENIEMYLRGGYKRDVLAEDGRIYSKMFYDPMIAKVNERGVRGIMNIVQSNINSAVVQGNYSQRFYLQRLETIHKNVAEEVCVNQYLWEIKDEDYTSIVNFIINLIVPFMSRTINNLERESYAKTIKAVQTIREDIGKNEISRM